MATLVDAGVKIKRKINCRELIFDMICETSLGVDNQLLIRLSINLNDQCGGLQFSGKNLIDSILPSQSPLMEIRGVVNDFDLMENLSVLSQ